MTSFTLLAVIISMILFCIYLGICALLFNTAIKKVYKYKRSKKFYLKRILSKSSVVFISIITITSSIIYPFQLSRLYNTSIPNSSITESIETAIKPRDWSDKNKYPGVDELDQTIDNAINEIQKN